MGPVAGGPPSLCRALAPAPGLCVRPQDDPRQQRGRGCRGRESRVGGRPASARRPSSCLLLQADVRGHWDGRALTLPAPRGPGAHAARHCTDSPPLVTEANSGFLRDAWPVPPRSTRSRSSRVRPRPSAPASMRCDFRPALRGVPVRAVLDVSFLVSVWRFRAGLTWCRRPEARRPPRPGPRPRPRGSRAGAAAGLLLVRGKGSMGPGPWPRHRVRWGSGLDGETRAPGRLRGSGGHGWAGKRLCSTSEFNKGRGPPLRLWLLCAPRQAPFPPGHVRLRPGPGPAAAAGAAGPSSCGQTLSPRPRPSQVILVLLLQNYFKRRWVKLHFWFLICGRTSPATSAWGDGLRAAAPVCTPHPFTELRPRLASAHCPFWTLKPQGGHGP